jgi:hypothetical protein
MSNFDPVIVEEHPTLDPHTVTAGCNASACGLVHNAYRIDLSGDSLRRRRSVATARAAN